MRRCFRYEIYSDLELDIRILHSFLVYARHRLFRLLYSTVGLPLFPIGLAHLLPGSANGELYDNGEFLPHGTSVTGALRFYLRMVGHHPSIDPITLLNVCSTMICRYIDYLKA